MALNERSKALYQPWNQEGFNADMYVRKMTSVQRWIYKTLLQEAFVCSTRPRLPDDDEQLWLMADCDDLDQWLKNKTAVLRMFERTQEDGIPLLLHRRLEEDWSRLLEKRESKAEAGRRGAERRWGKPIATDSTAIAPNSIPMANDAKGSEVSKVREVSEEKEETVSDSSFQNYGQGDDMNLKAFKAEITSVGAERGVKVHGYDSQWSDLKILSTSHGSQAVINDFGDFLDEGGEYPKGALTSYLWVAADRLIAGSPAAVLASAKDPEVVSLVRELTYASDGQIAFLDKQRARLADVLKEFSAEEITSAFKAWLGDQDLSDPKNVSFLPGKFVQIADGLCYSARKRKAEADAARVQRDAAVFRLQAEAETERQKAEAEKASEAEIFDPLA